MPISRRLLLAGGTAALGTVLASATRHAEALDSGSNVLSPAERARLRNLASRFAETYELPGLGVAITRNGALVYAEALGLADIEARIPLMPTHRFRIASISKPITAVAIFALVEQGRLRLADRIFGEAGILGREYGPVPAHSSVGDITLEHLLTHSSGGWPNGPGDPMWGYPSFDHAALIAWTLKERPLDHPPGTVFAYSNFGYCLLGRVIEKATRRPYAEFVNQVVLSRVGAADMVIAGNTLAERHPNEVRYYGRGKDDPYAMNVRRMDSHGGWIARPAELALFAAGIGASPSRLLKAETIAAMTRPSAANRHYAKGWRVNENENWWHTGHLPGTAGTMVRTHTGLCWAILTNTRHRRDAFDRDLDRLGWSMVRAVPRWQA